MASLVHGAHDEGVVDLPFSFVLARRAGRIVLVDTGFMNEGSGAEMSVQASASPTGSRRCACWPSWASAPEAVTDIVLSHAHFDHMGSIGKFPNAQIHIQKREILSWIEAMALPPRFGFLTQIINPDDLRRAFDASVEHRLNLIDGDRDDVLPGLHVRLGEGHTLGQQFVILETAARPPRRFRRLRLCRAQYLRPQP